MEQTIIFIGLLACTWLFVSGAGSIQSIKSFLNLHNEAKIKSIALSIVRELINCALCSGFWIGFGFYFWIGHDHFFLMACLVSVCAEIFSRIMNLILNQWMTKL